MNQEKYIGMDVHQATISVAVMDSSLTDRECKCLSERFRSPLTESPSPSASREDESRSPRPCRRSHG
jgi:hypothetical protein